MAPELKQLQKKPKRTGFFVLLLIIAVVVFAAYALTKKQNNLSSVQPKISQSEKEEILNFIKNPPPAITVEEKKEIYKELANSKKPKPVSQQEKEAMFAELKQ